MKKLNYKRKSNGSALILVLAASILILTLGTVSLASALTNIRMASKVQTNNSEYYFLEKASQKAVSDLDKQLVEAENLALSYMEQELYKNEYSDVYGNSVVGKLANPYNNQGLINEIWKAEVYTPSLIPGTDIVNNALYSQGMDIFFKEAFNRLYYSFTLTMLREGRLNIANNSENNGERTDNAKYYEAYYTANVGNNPSKNYDNFYIGADVSSSLKTWNDYELQPNDLKMSLKVYGCNTENGAEALSNGRHNVSGKKIEGRNIDGIVSIIPPVYEGVSSVMYTKNNINPVYTAAIVSSNGITFNGGTQSINGETIAMGGKGITLNNATVNIKGNVCTGGVINLNNESKLSVDNFIAGDYKMKASVFNGEDVFYDIRNDDILTLGISEPKIWNIIEDSATPYGKCMPFLFKDTNGGNTYCYGVLLNNGNNNTSFTTRNILYNGSINTNNCINSSFNVNGLAISTLASNSIGRFDNNIISVNRSFIGNAMNDSYGTYDAGTTSRAIDTYRTAMGKNTLNNILNARAKHLGTYGMNLNTFVSEGLLGGTPSNPAEPDRIPEFNMVDDTVWNANNIVKYLKSDSVLDLNGRTLKGIIYCKGNLTIKDSASGGLIQGCVIANGNVTVEGDVQIDYSEADIINTLSFSRVSRIFFRPGEMGSGFELPIANGKGGKEEINNSLARTRTSKDRYKITKWVRSRVK